VYRLPRDRSESITRSPLENSQHLLCEAVTEVTTTSRCSYGLLSRSITPEVGGGKAHAHPERNCEYYVQ
jgi:hypothetical protein